MVGQFTFLVLFTQPQLKFNMEYSAIANISVLVATDISGLKRYAWDRRPERRAARTDKIK